MCLRITWGATDTMWLPLQILGKMWAFSQRQGSESFALKRVSGIYRLSSCWYECVWVTLWETSLQAVVLKRQHDQDFLDIVLKHRLWPYPATSDATIFQWSSRICISHKVSGEALKLLLGPHFENYSFPVLEKKISLVTSMSQGNGTHALLIFKSPSITLSPFTDLKSPWELLESSHEVLIWGGGLVSVLFKSCSPPGAARAENHHPTVCSTEQTTSFSVFFKDSY